MFASTTSQLFSDSCTQRTLLAANLCRRPIAGLMRARRLELEPRGFDVDIRSQLVDIAITISVQRDVGRKVERGGGQLLRESAGRIREIIVAIDENARRLLR